VGVIYLSPAFTRRSGEDLQLLQNLDGRSGFCLFWLDIVRPLLCQIKSKCLLEIGADEGSNTKILSMYCDAFDATLTVIDPVLKPPLEKIVSASKGIKMLVGKSHDVLPTLNQPIDAVFLEGDLNYYTTYGDLKAIKDLADRQNIGFPLIFVRSASWPYARRDMYYNPANLPKQAVHDHEKSGMTPWSSQLKEMMTNYLFENTKYEGGPKNGVWTAVEDFVADSDLPLQIFSLPTRNGLGVMYPKGSKVEQFINQNFAIPEKIRLFLETCEIARINEVNQRQQIKLQQRQSIERKLSGIRGFIAGVLRNLGRKILGRIEK
jgi:hypothetical protein